MADYIAMVPVRLGAGARLQLTAAQAAARAHALTPPDEAGWRTAQLPVEFKAGECFGYAGDLPRVLAEDLAEALSAGDDEPKPAKPPKAARPPKAEGGTDAPAGDDSAPPDGNPEPSAQ